MPYCGNICHIANCCYRKIDLDGDGSLTEVEFVQVPLIFMYLTNT